ncbi:MAG: radical SAM protein, partial [SAR324 cluster bacterium]|nr:radical SAM protein [SAR324 cluster bacterium]
MSGLHLIEHNLHEVSVGDRRILFHIPTSSLFELDQVGSEMLTLFRAKATVEAEDVRRHFDGRFPPGQVVETIKEFLDLDILNDGRPMRMERAPVEVNSFPLSTVVLNINTGCNLSCTYCYKEDLVPASQGERMEFETAVDSIELLLREGASRDRINVVFFGGEPLSNMPLIKRVVNYAQGRCIELGKKVDFTLTTNATLLTEALVDYFNAHRFGLTISMDGPKALHDLRRKTVGGKGSYDVVARNVRMLLARYRSRPVGARVTLTKGVTDVVLIHDH